MTEVQKSTRYHFIIFVVILLIVQCSPNIPNHTCQTRQLTFDPQNHNLDNGDNFSPDDKWLVYDTRSNGIGRNTKIEKVNVETGARQLVYRTSNQSDYGPGVGAAFYAHNQNRIAFIHGLKNCNAENPYAKWRRFGMIVDEDNNSQVIADARDITFPYTPGALRGGTHRHEWSHDGEWLAFTYDDAIMEQLERKTGKKVNLRTMGVTKLGTPVAVDKDWDGENHAGSGFSVLIVKIVPEPEVLSDEISSAYGDSWVGQKGYLKETGDYQRARVFLGKTRDKNSGIVSEVFIVDIPEQIDIPGDHGPLAGTEETMPSVPMGAIQRRLTRTVDNKYPGVAYVRSSPDGSIISYFAKDSTGKIQLFFMPTNGGEVQQVSFCQDLRISSSTLRWNPNGKEIAFVAEDRVYACNVEPGADFGELRPLSQQYATAPQNLVWSHDGKNIAFNRSVQTQTDTFNQIFLIDL